MPVIATEWRSRRLSESGPLPTMGLDLLVHTPDGDGIAYGEKISSYSGFHEFRKAWANLLGFSLEQMDGFGGTTQWDRQPLRCFFDHSDCDGEIAWQDAEHILAQARRDAAKLPEFDHQFQVLMAACEAAAASRMPVVFC